MDRVRVIERTLWAYYAAWWSFIPILGLVPGVVAFALFWRVRSEVGTGWNPAGAYLRWGVLIAFVGTGISAAILAVPVVRLIF